MEGCEINKIKPLYYVTPNLSLGVGVGLSSYIITNTISLFLDVRFHPINSNVNYVIN